MRSLTASSPTPTMTRGRGRPQELRWWLRWGSMPSRKWFQSLIPINPFKYQQRALRRIGLIALQFLAVPTFTGLATSMRSTCRLRCSCRSGFAGLMRSVFLKYIQMFVSFPPICTFICFSAFPSPMRMSQQTCCWAQLRERSGSMIASGHQTSSLRMNSGKRFKLALLCLCNP